MSGNQRSNEAMDFLDLKNTFGPIIEPEGFDTNDMVKEIKKLCILSFFLDKKGTNTIARASDGRIVFVDRDHLNQVAVGDVWLCSILESGLVYYATPLKKITAATAMDFSPELRKEIVESLYKTNMPSFKREFERKYREEIYNKALEESETKHQDIIESLKRRIEDLSNQLNQSMVVIESRRSEAMEPEEEEILLGEGYPGDAAPQSPQDEEEIMLGAAERTSPQPVPAYVPQALFTNNVQGAPGLPEMLNISTPQRQEVQREIHVERLDGNTLYCDQFPDGKYFVHINMSKKFLLIRYNSFGQVVCINHRMVLDGLEEISSFVGQKRLVSQMNQRYGGLLVYL